MQEESVVIEKPVELVRFKVAVYYSYQWFGINTNDAQGFV